MKKLLFIIVPVFLIGMSASTGWAKTFQLKDHSDVMKNFKIQSDGGTDKVSPETQANQEPSKGEILAAVKAYVEKTTSTEGIFEIPDGKSSQKRHLQLIEFNNQAIKVSDGNYYYANVDFKDADTGELVVVDFDVTGRTGQVQVVQAQIYSINGKARYIYGAGGKRMYFEVSQ